MGNLLVVSKLSWPDGGGGELATYLIIRDILSKHFSVTTVSGTAKPYDDLLKCCKYVYWPQLKTAFKPSEWLGLAAGMSVLRKLIRNADIVYIPSQSLLPLVMITKRIEPKIKVIVHLHNFQPISYTSILLANQFNDGVLTDISRSVRLELLENRSLSKALTSGFMSLFNFVNSYSLTLANKVVTVSQKHAEILSNRMPALAQKISVAYNPLPEIQPPERKSEQPSLVYPGGGSYVKGFHVLVQAAVKIVERRKGVSFLFPKGSRKLTPEYEYLIRKLNIHYGGKFPFVTYQSHKDLLRLYSQSHAVVVPSICEEPLPYVVVEAMAMCTLPIASKVGGIPEIVHGTYAEKTMFDPGDVNALIDVMEKIVSLDKRELSDIGAGLKDSISNRFRLETISKKFAEIFDY